MIIFCSDTFLRTCNGTGPFTEVRHAFQDVAVCLNLETALSGEQAKKKDVILVVDEAALDWLDEVQVLTIVNNHTSDTGDPQRLVRALTARKKVVVGPGNPSAANVIIDGISIDFFAAYFTLPRLRLSYNGKRADALERLLRNSTAERKVVNLHWGYEHTDVPAPFQRNLAYRLVAAGADLIIGHHPHVPQGCEEHKGKTIYYSLGNFNFWQFKGENRDNNRWGYMVRYDPHSGKAEPIPYRVNDNYQPCLVSSVEKIDLLSRLQGLSELLRKVDTGVWFKTEYANWYRREIRIWRRECLNRFSISLWLKGLVWLFLPMQLKHYYHQTLQWITKVLKKNEFPY